MVMYDSGVANDKELGPTRTISPRSMSSLSILCAIRATQVVTEEVSRHKRLTVFAVEVSHDQTASARRSQPCMPYLPHCIRLSGRIQE